MKVKLKNYVKIFCKGFILILNLLLSLYMPLALLANEKDYLSSSFFILIYYNLILFHSLKSSVFFSYSHHSFGESALLHKVFFKAFQLLEEQVVRLID